VEAPVCSIGCVPEPTISSKSKVAPVRSNSPFSNASELVSEQAVFPRSVYSTHLIPQSKICAPVSDTASRVTFSDALRAWALARGIQNVECFVARVM
jgi:hypothetical protein